ncbi:ATP-grasp domain-containing protein, partial [bacterium]|nr:ATP-grasp domain-containing protein [bacterium]
MKKILILGTKNYDLSLSIELKKIGLRSYFCGNIKSSLIPKHKWINIDYTNQLALLKFLKTNNYFEYIIPGSNDLAYLSVSNIYQLNKKLTKNIINIDQIDLAEKYLLKTNFRKQMLPPMVKSPKIIKEDKLNKVNFKFVLKQDNLSGGKGVIFFDNIDQFQKYINKIKVRKPYVLEEYIEGTGHGASFFLEHGVINYEFFDNEYYCKDKLAVVATSSPTNLSNKNKGKLREFCYVYFKKYNLVNGLFHVQCICRDNEIYITECTRRLPGDYYHEFASLSTGHSYLKYYINGFLKQQKCLPIIENKLKNIVRIVCDELINKKIKSNVHFQKIINKNLIYKQKLDGFRISSREKKYKKLEAIF